jgi:hypothetical protein
MADSLVCRREAEAVPPAHGGLVALRCLDVRIITNSRDIHFGPADFLAINH